MRKKEKEIYYTITNKRTGGKLALPDIVCVKFEGQGHRSKFTVIEGIKYC